MRGIFLTVIRDIGTGFELALALEAPSQDEDDEIAYFTVRWKTRASFVYRTKTSDNTEKDSKNRKRSH